MFTPTPLRNAEYEDKSLIGGQLREWFGEQNPYSAEGQQRAENQRARDFSSEEAQKQRDFEERMSNTSFQRGMADMQAAGLNPILAYDQGGASTPSGAAASGAGTAQTAHSNPIGLMGKLAQIILGSVANGAKIASMNDMSMQRVLAMKEMNDARNVNAWKIQEAKNDTIWGIHNHNAANRMLDKEYYRINNKW